MPCSSPHELRRTCPGITWRLCGRLGASVAQDLRALRLWQSSRQWHAVPWSCMDAAPGCRSSEALLSQHIDGVARASSAGTKSAGRSRAPCLVLLTILVIGARVSRSARLGDQQLARARRRSELTNRRRRCHTGSRLPAGTSVGDLPTSSVSAVQLIPEYGNKRVLREHPPYCSIN